jgi:putative membrane protein
MNGDATPGSLTGPACSAGVFVGVVAGLTLALIASGIAPHDRLTWLMETLPAMIAVLLLLATRTAFPLTTLCYLLILFHGLVLIVGGIYTYAQVPAGYWVEHLLGLSRNPYDRFGHLVQGFVPAIVAREILIRKFLLRPGKFLFFVTVCICLAISALYELIEWWAALALGQDAQAFLGTQGDPWDTQWDMFCALIGACASLVLSRVHDRQIRGLAQAVSSVP